MQREMTVKGRGTLLCIRVGRGVPAVVDDIVYWTVRELIERDF